MSKVEEMQELHRRAIAGETLTAEESSVLQDWYEVMDAEEDAILNGSHSQRSSADLRENLFKATRQISRISNEIEALTTQNAKLRSENHALRKAVEATLLERVA